MKKRKEEDRIVYQSLAMVTQFGLNMIVPICLLSAAGVWLDRKFGTSYLTILLFAAGAVAGGQNVYRMAKRLYGNGEGDEEQGDADEDNRDIEENE
ncbi:AtpZ/AtpI family protein [Acetatifactor muris]|jgi:predicted F0F1-ATPase subunit|uniref:AtpZ/AtpI family protein n=1 Tax=Acetatifactor muris TaxID=879566 RepID=UPI0023F33218|nr:AtpZ/AtpI family protein [Acetatifactor muris]